jgi:hypothetical protein
LDFLSPFLQDKFNPLHVPMACQTAVAIFPTNRHIPPLNCGDRAKISLIAIEANARTNR